jgi:monoamine oxidase
MKHNTIIIGAGISGLTIAAGLETPDFLILEARGRIGGRVLTNQDTHLDMGAAWIHGSIDNPLNQFLDYGRDMIPVAPSNPWIHSELASVCHLISSTENSGFDESKMSEDVRQQIATKWQGVVKQIAAIPGKTIAEACAEVCADVCDDRDIKPFLYMMEVWCGGSVANIPTSYLCGSPGDYPGSHYLFKNGAITLVDAIVANSKHDIAGRVLVNKVATDIIYGDQGVNIIVADGSQYFCEKLCITIPPGPLLDIRFSPPLTTERRDALSQIKMGSYKKIQLVFEREDVFWTDTPMFLTCERDKYTMWNNYMYSKNKPVIEAVCPANIGWAMSNQSDEEIMDQIMSNLRTFYPRAPDPVS